MNESAESRLEKAYFELIKNTHYTKISVSDLIKLAGVSRTTFYRHYVDVIDMHRRICEKMGEAFFIKCLDKVVSLESEEEITECILEIFRIQEKYVALISGENGSRYFFENIYFNVSRKYFEKRTDLTERDLFRLRFLTGAMMGAYVKNIIEKTKSYGDSTRECRELFDFSKLKQGDKNVYKR